MENVFYDNWENLVKIICITPLAYVSLVVLLRVSGKRTLTKMNAFDFVITIALGSLLASVCLNHSIPLANGVTAMLTLIGLQFLFTWLSVRVKSFKTIITSRPVVIFYKGEFFDQTMKKERITVEEVNSAARQQGISTLQEIDIIVLETTGDIAIIEKITGREETTLEDVGMNM